MLLRYIVILIQLRHMKSSIYTPTLQLFAAPFEYSRHEYLQ